MIDTAVWRPSWACQWPMPAFLVILEKTPVERVRRVRGAVLVAEHEVVGLPYVAGFAALTVLPDIVRLESCNGALRQDERAL